MTERREDLPDRIREYYAARAEEYDASAGYQDSVAERKRSSIKARFQKALANRDVLEIACGTGYWTAVIAVTARSVLAMDINREMIAVARKRCAGLPNVEFAVADAYTMDNIHGHFTAAFSHWWWSHIPKSEIATFLRVVHSKLAPGALVLFADQLAYEWPARRYDEEGNLLERRVLRDGREYEIVKNFPSASEMKGYLGPIAERVRYSTYSEGYWVVTCYTKREPD